MERDREGWAEFSSPAGGADDAGWNFCAEKALHHQPKQEVRCSMDLCQINRYSSEPFKKA